MSITWNDPIKGYLAPSVDHMKQVTGGGIDLGDYESVKTNIDEISARIEGKSMPPGGGWPDSQIADFKAWTDADLPEGDDSPTDSTPDVSSITWNDPIKGYLAGSAGHMKQISGGNLDLADYDNVKAHAKQLWAVIETKSMPPGGGWPDSQIVDFKDWLNAGCPES